MIEHLQRTLHFEASEVPQDKLGKLEQRLSRSRFLQSDTLPLLASLLSLPHPEGAPPLTLTPQEQKQRTFDTLIAWLFEEAEQVAVYSVWEDLQWADPSTLELLTLCLDQVPMARMLMLVTFRPDFTPPWPPHSHLSQLVLSRLGQRHIGEMVKNVTGGKALPAEILQQVLAKTDGVPLFVEELTKMVLESGLLTEANGQYALAGPLPPLAIPSTLQDSLMARLDRLTTSREIAQLGATIGREFSYTLLHTVSLFDATTLQQGLRQLVDAELVYQHGVLPQATYIFKYSLVQETAYQSLLKIKRQQVHQQIAQALEERFPDTLETQPELVARHYTETGLGEKAIPYWQQAGERAAQRSANAEAINQLMKGIELLGGLPDTPERAHQELAFLTTLGPALIAVKGNAAPEVERTYARARELCKQMGETPELFPVVFGLRSFYLVRGEIQTAHELGMQLLTIAQHGQDTGYILEAHLAVGNTLFFRGEFVSARAEFEQGLKLYDPQQHHAHAFVYGLDPGIFCLCRLAWILWFLGYPDQALEKEHELLTLAQEVSHPFSLALAFMHSATLHLHRHEGPVAQEHIEAAMTLCTEQSFVSFLGQTTILLGWNLAGQRQTEEGIPQMRKGLATCQATGAVLFRPYYLTTFAAGHVTAGHAEEGLSAVAEAQALMNETGERFSEAELFRVKGELLLTQAGKGQQSNGENKDEAEQCFHQALDVARELSAKSLELRAATSLARLWQQQGKTGEARQLLSEVYNWFTEGFDTADLKDARALLGELV